MLCTILASSLNGEGSLYKLKTDKQTEVKTSPPSTVGGGAIYDASLEVDHLITRAES